MAKTIYTKAQERLVKRLLQARQDSGLTQVQVAKKLERTQSYVSKIESGEINLDAIQLKQLARLYSKEISYFLE